MGVHLKAMVGLTQVSGVAADRAWNVLHFDATNVPNAVTDLVADIPDAYEQVVGIVSGNTAKTGHILKIYNMTDPEPRAPIWDSTWDFVATPSGTQHPNEIALCLSFQAARESGVPQARRRGRIYIGPLDDGNDDGNGRPSSGAINAVVAMGNTLLSNSAASTNYSWVVYSTADAAVNDVDNGWVDNAYDVQRRRGVAPTSRTLF